MRQLNLYTTLGCHLCDEAEAMVRKQAAKNIKLELVEISESDKLIEDYGVRIPVIKFRHEKKELAWPFSDEELRVFLVNGKAECL